MHKTFTYKDTVTLLSIASLIIIVIMFNTLFLNFIFISIWGVKVSFGNRMNKINEQFAEADRINKEINDGKN